MLHSPKALIVPQLGRLTLSDDRGAVRDRATMLPDVDGTRRWT